MKIALLLIDFQRAFIDGAWAQRFGLDQTLPISAAAKKAAELFRSGALQRIPIICSRCYPNANDCDPPEELKEYLSDLIHVWKYNMNIMQAEGFAQWLEAQIHHGVRTLVIGGCTTTSCVRVSSQAVQQAFASYGLQVIVDLSICGARRDNYDPALAKQDPVLISLYKELVEGKSAVELAIVEMERAGVRVVQDFDWQHVE